MLFIVGISFDGNVALLRPLKSESQKEEQGAMEEGSVILVNVYQVWTVGRDTGVSGHSGEVF